MKNSLSSRIDLSRRGWLLLLAVMAVTRQLALSQAATNLPPLADSIGAWGDYDNDGLMDVILGGTIEGVAGLPDGRFTRLYHNEGSGLFREIAAPLPQLDSVSAAWGDFDSDGDLDLLIGGMASSPNGPVGVIDLFRNDGGHQFTKVVAGLEALAQSSVAWVDWDNDGRQDIFLTGQRGATGDWVALLFRNTGIGTFALHSPALPSPASARGYWADYDNDGDADLLLGGSGTVQLLRNEGSGVLTNSGVPFPNGTSVISTWGDFDGNGALDFFSSDCFPCAPPRLYQNTDGNLTGSSQSSLPMWVASAVWGDLDNSGRASVLVTGWYPLQQGVWGSATRLYVNLSGTWQESVTLAGRTVGSMNWVDYDGDGDLDIFYTGQNALTLWSNNVAFHRDIVPPPQSLLATFNALDEVMLSWQAPSNAPPTDRALSYNVRVGRSPSGTDVMSPMANVVTGQRLIPVLGNAGAARRWKLTGLPPGTYYWGVQSIGQSFTGSPFAPEGIFTVTSSPPVMVTQPVDQDVFASSNATFVASAIGTKPLAYSWRKNGIPLPANDIFSGVTGPILTIANAQPGLAGDYSVVVTNTFGSTTSATARLIVRGEPRILEHPSDQYSLLTRTARFSVQAAGAVPLTYHWLLGGSRLSDSGRVSGSSSATLVIQNVQVTDVGNYSVIVSNAWGAVTSAVATLNIATTRYVNLNNPTPAPPYTSWASAATVLQDAIDAAGIGDEILVTNGTYAVGGRAINGALLSRAAVYRPVTLRSVNGPEVTIIRGVRTGSGTRCVYLTNGASLIGFSLQNGGARNSGDWRYDRSGGGLFCESVSAVASNCWISANRAYVYGGGAYSGTLIHCLISGNTTSESGGGTAFSGLEHCSISGNSARAGGGAYYGTLNDCVITSNGAGDPSGARIGGGGGAYFANLTNCTLLNNSARVSGGGAVWSTLVNSLVAGNSALQGGGTSAGMLINCTVVGNSANTDGQVGGGVGGGVLGVTVLNSIVVDNHAFWAYPDDNFRDSTFTNSCTYPIPVGRGNFNADPAFLDSAAGNFHLRSDSPCVNVGANGFVETSVDRDGRPRIVEGTVDLGAYEYGHVPFLLTSPVSQSVILFSNVAFTVSALGDSPLAYQWFKDGVRLTDDSRISGTGTPSLTIANLQLPDAGGYWLAVTNASGSVTSAVAALTLLGPPSISVQPVSRIVPASSNIVFSVTASGLATLSYQWRFNQSDLFGATNTSLSLSNVQSAHAGSYDVVISSIYGGLTSDMATLTVVPVAPVITAQPVSRVVSIGQDVSFAVAARGTEPISCQWQREGTNLPGATGFTLALTGVNSSRAGTYRAILSSSAGGTSSTNVTLVVSPVVIWGRTNQQPVGSVALPSSATNVVALAAGKSSEGGSPSLVLRADGTLVSWGGFTSVPPNATNAIAISSGGPDSRATENNLALLMDGSIVNWSTSSKPPPPAVTNANFVAIAAGGQHQLALRDDGAVFAWGSNTSGQTNVPLSATNVVAIAAGASHSLALRTDGTVAGWGLNTSGEATALSNAFGVVAIAACGAQSIALLIDGSVTGRIVTNSGGQLPLYGPPPAHWTNITAISAGQFHSLALRNDGTVLGWGYTNFLQSTSPAGLSNVVAISAGAYHNLALVRDPFAPPLPPRFGRPPARRAVTAGQTAVFNTLAVGTPPLTYQWYRDGQPLAAQTRSTLTLNYVLPGSAGNYQLVARNESGSVTSTVASVSVVLPPPRLIALGGIGGNFLFTFTSVNGLNYMVESKDDLGLNVWRELERRSGTGGLEIITDVTSAPGSPGAKRVYRVKVE